jgi:hypothetical protein
MTTDQPSANTSTAVPSDRQQSNGWRTFGIVVITMAVTLSVGYWVVTSWLFPTEFEPVVLNQEQQQTLDLKIELLGGNLQSSKQEALEPEAYSEVSASREVEFSERELNALLAKNTELANKLAIDLSDNLVSAKLLVDVDPDFPVFGGKTIKVTGGMELRLVESRPSAVLKGISVWGVPLPNAWLDNMKNVDLVREFGNAGGFWQAINEGVEKIEVRDGRLLIQLKE